MMRPVYYWFDISTATIISCHLELLWNNWWNLVTICCHFDSVQSKTPSHISSLHLPIKWFHGSKQIRSSCSWENRKKKNICEYTINYALYYTIQTLFTRTRPFFTMNYRSYSNMIFMKLLNAIYPLSLGVYIWCPRYTMSNKKAQTILY